jgi:hypothetical protein
MPKTFSRAVFNKKLGSIPFVSRSYREKMHAVSLPSSNRHLQSLRPELSRFSPTDILRMQQTIGNSAVRRQVSQTAKSNKIVLTGNLSYTQCWQCTKSTAQQQINLINPRSVSIKRTVIQRRQAASSKKTPLKEKANLLKTQVSLGRFIDPPKTPTQSDLEPQTSGGAFWILNGLGSDEMTKVLGLCGKAVRTKLVAHISDTEGRFDRPRIELALIATARAETEAGTGGIEIIDAVRSSGTGSFGKVWALLAGKPRTTLISLLRTLPRSILVLIQARIPEVPAANISSLNEIVSDLLGTGTNMQANDVIDLEGFSGLDRVMASIYNLRGQLLAEKARDLGVPTHAAAGIMKVESGGSTFGVTTGKTILRFENHVFWREWGRSNVAKFNAHFDFDRTSGGKPFQQHRFRGSPTDAWEPCHKNQDQEWRVIEFAAGLSGEEPAFRSASWGAGQIMGFNAHVVGYHTAKEMVASFNRAERSQITGIFEYIRANHLAGEVVRGNYIAVARGYNGAGQAAAYSALIQNAAESYRRVTAGKMHVIS